MRSEIDPLADDEESARKMLALRKRIAELALENVALPDLAFIELHVYKPLQEEEIRKRSYRLDLTTDTEWIEIDPRGEPLQQVNVAN